MRITNHMMTYNYLSSLNKSLERQNSLTEKLSDGLEIHRPSDDPVKVVRSLKFHSSLNANDQYIQNAKDAQSWMTMSDNSMQDLSSIMTEIKGKVVEASNSNPQDALQAIGASVDNMINQMVNIGNTKIGERYIFAGQNDQTAPFVRNGDVITYSGDDTKISMPIQPGVATPTQDSINLTGQEVFGAADPVTGTPKILQDLIDIKNHLMSGTTGDQKWLSDTGLDNLAKDQSQMLQSHTALGTRMATYNMAQDMLDGNNTIISQQVAGNEGLDVPKAITDYKTNESVYKMALQIGANILPLSLADFLK
ncbi:MAG: flagellar hook-associated protein FlgL [Veillonellales bacterium]